MDIYNENNQRNYWDDWVNRSFEWETNEDNIRRGYYIVSEVRKRIKPDLKILDVGCGTGWLSREMSKYGAVTANDYSINVINKLKNRYREIEWIGGDFLSIEIPENYFDIVTCVEVIAHVPDQEAFAQRIASVLRKDGTLLLTTQNEYIWNRSSSLGPPGAGQIRNWPSRARLKELFGSNFKLRKIRTCAPGGDRGWLWLINNRIGRKIGNTLLGKESWIKLRESMGLGCSLFISGTRI